jgi:hypothetical protein
MREQEAGGERERGVCERVIPMFPDELEHQAEIATGCLGPTGVVIGLSGVNERTPPTSEDPDGVRKAMMCSSASGPLRGFFMTKV